MADIQIPSNSELKKLITRVEQEQGEDVLYAPFGVEDENIQVYETIRNNLGQITEYKKWGNLRNFFDEWNSFKEAWDSFLEDSKHIQYGSKEPDSPTVKVWFQTPTLAVNTEQISDDNSQDSD